MRFEGGSSANRRSRWRRWARQNLGIALCAGAGSAAAQGAGATPGLVAPLVIGALALGLGVALAQRTARALRRVEGELREARTRARCLEPLLQAWVWQSDATHRLIAPQPSTGAAPAESATPLAWERFTVAEPLQLRRRLEAGEAIDDLEAEFVEPGGTPRAGRLSARPHVDAAGRLAGFHGVFRAHATAVDAAAAPAPAQPAAPVPAPLPAASDHESFSYTVSHDLRAPIRVVEGFTKIIKEDYGALLDRVGNDHLDRVLGAAARMNRMIDSLLALSQLSSQPLGSQPVDLSQLAAYVVDDLRRQWPERNVEVDIDPSMQVHGDPTLLRVVIENLLGNAWKYTGKATHPAVRFTRDPARADTFVVQDNGAGFDMRFADRLFGVFQRLHSANDFPGNGVGLASVRRIVRRHGGEIRGEAEVNGGARFCFSLPQTQAGDAA